MSRDLNARRIHSVRIDNSTFERVEEFKYLGTTLTIITPSRSVKLRRLKYLISTHRKCWSGWDSEHLIPHAKSGYPVGKLSVGIPHKFFQISPKILLHKRPKIQRIRHETPHGHVACNQEITWEGKQTCCLPQNNIDRSGMTEYKKHERVLYNSRDSSTGIVVCQG